MFGWPGCEELKDLGDRCRKAAVEDVSLGSNDELRAAVLELERARSALDAVEGHCLAELEARDGCDVDLGQSTTAWLMWEGHLPRRVASARVRTANKLRRELDGVDRALGGGRISFEHARVLADAANPRVADAIAGVQDRLVESAESSPFGAWQRGVAELVELADQDGGHDPADDVSRNRLHADRVGDTVEIRGQLVGDAALSFAEALEQATEALWRRYKTDHDACPDIEIPARSVLRALALVELCRHGLAETRPGPVVDITLVINPDDGTVRAPDGDRVDPRTCSHLFCDPILHALVIRPSEPLDLKRSVRFATPHQRRVLAIRDRGCRFPGCGAPPSWCDAHHITYWDRRGDTDISNLVLLCRRHHGVTHRHGWTLTTHPNGDLTWTTPTGRTLTSRKPQAS
jgi:Domain of unknown function (DUF222)/HNH endonuclease